MGSSAAESPLNAERYGGNLVRRILNPSRVFITLLIAFAVTCVLPAQASAQARVRFTTFSASPAGRQVRQDGTSCPNQSGILDSVSVPVSQPLTLAVVSSIPAPPGGATFQLSSADPSVVAAGDPHQSFLPMVTIPEGQTMSNPFQVFGIKVGSTTLDATAETSGFIGFSVPLGAWDVNPGADPSTKFLDANPPTPNTCRASGSPNLSTDPTVLSACGRSVKGAVSDGVTQLLMRMVSGLGGTACYSIVSTGPPDQGGVGTDVVATQNVGSLNYGFSFYKSPDGYGDTSDTRQVQVQFTFTPNIGNGNTTQFTANLTVARPPMMLLHGVWADASSWKTKFWVRQPQDSYFVYIGDYGPTHDSSFTTNFTKVQGFVAKALILARTQGNYAATQADVIGHSMGGILTRLYAGSATYMRPDNYNMGDIHRFITLDTPHGGSNFANLVIALHTTNPTDIENSVHSLVGANDDVTNGAVCDLAENSQGLTPLASPTSLTAQVITATGGPPVPKFFGGVLGNGNFEGELTKCVKRNLLFQCVQFLYNQTTVNDFRFAQANDAIVPLCSQQGGVNRSSCPRGGSAGINFPDLIHFGAEKWGITAVSGVTNTQAVATQVFSLLDGPKSGFASSVPGLAANGTGTAVTTPGLGASKDASNFTNQCKTGSPPPMKHNVVLTSGGIARVSAVAADTRLKVTAPVNGQVFAPGDHLLVNVSIGAGLVATEAGVSFRGLASVEGTGLSASGYQVNFSIPGNFAGPLEIVPTVRDAGNNLIIGVTTTIAVRPTTPPLSLSVTQLNDVLTSIGDTDRIHVTGTYAGSLDMDLTSSASGTTYVSSNTKVVTVDTEGNVKAIGFGTATVTVANSGVQIFVTFSVEDPTHPLAASDVSSQLTITRLGFRVDRNTGFLSQTVQWTNPLPVPVIGPLYFVVPNLPAGVTLINSGVTQNIAPVGSPFFKLALPDGITLQPGASLSRTLQFLDPARTQIAYTPKVFRTSTTP